MKKIAIIGSGVVGGATGKGFAAKKGYKVVFHDVHNETIHNLKKQGFNAKHVEALDVNESDVFFLIVGTPTEKGKINLKYLKEATKTLGVKLKNRKDYFVVVVRSTVLPQTTESIIIPLLEKTSGKKAGIDFGIAMNPEYLREKSADDDFKNPWIVTVGCLDERSQDFMKEIFSSYSCEIHYLSLREAEMQKYVHNLYNAVKIAFFNEIRIMCNSIDINPDTIFDITTRSAEGFWNPEYGIKNMGPFDGMCLPKDTQAFAHWSKKLGIHLDLLNGTITSNKKFKKIWEKNKKV